MHDVKPSQGCDTFTSFRSCGWFNYIETYRSVEPGFQSSLETGKPKSDACKHQQGGVINDRIYEEVQHLAE
ncbi:MAG: hypothetical protein P9L97_09890 [Candidatus Tenebribacter davisii]|nr:hypothetical protein [Candidatus Tenebribacter davisii]